MTKPTTAANAKGSPRLGRSAKRNSALTAAKLEEFLLLWRRLDRGQQAMAQALLEWMAAGSPPSADPRNSWPADVQGRLRAAGLF